jgi:carboxymethylenebutenolidase
MTIAPELTVETADGATFAAYLALPQTVPAPAIVILPPVFGVDQQMRDLADRCAARGFLATPLNQFWRDREPRTLARTGDERERAMARARRVDATPNDVDVLVDDIRATVMTLRARADCNGRVAVAGYCFGGRYAFLAAARLDIDAAAAFHGTQIGWSLDEGPRVDVPLSFHFGGDDPLTPPDEIAAIRAAVAHRDDAQMIVYPGAVHNFSQPGWPGYDPQAATLSEERTLTLFDDLKT